jgi:hypothetical protein
MVSMPLSAEEMRRVSFQYRGRDCLCGETVVRRWPRITSASGNQASERGEERVRGVGWRGRDG